MAPERPAWLQAKIDRDTELRRRKRELGLMPTRAQQREKRERVEAAYERARHSDRENPPPF